MITALRRWPYLVTFLGLAALLFLAGPVVADEGGPDVTRHIVAIGEPTVTRMAGKPPEKTDCVTTVGVLLAEDKVLTSYLAVTRRALDLARGKVEGEHPFVGGDELLGPNRELAAVERVPIHVWDYEAKKTRTVQGTLIATDAWRSLALYQLPEKFPGRAVGIYEGKPLEGLRVSYCPVVAPTLSKGVVPDSVASGILRVNPIRGDGDWAIMFHVAPCFRGAGVFADGKLVGIVPEFTHYKVEVSPSHRERSGPAVYVITAKRIRKFLKEHDAL